MKVIVVGASGKIGSRVADLPCGHTRHFRHNPPWQEREWVTTPEGRDKFLGSELDCQECDAANRRR